MATFIVSANTTGTYIGNNTSVADTFINQAAATTAYGTSTTLYVRDGAASDTENSILSFPGLSSLPAGTINSVTIAIFRDNSANPSMLVDLHALLRTYSDLATWNTYDGTNNWTTAGGTGAGTDISTTLSATITIGNAAQYYTVSSAQLVTDVAAGVTKWHLTPNSPAATGYYRQITSAEGTDGQRPAIIVDYTPSGPFSGTAVSVEKITQHISTTIIAGPFHISDYLRSSPIGGGALRTNLSGLHAYWYDNAADIGTTPTTTSVTATTDSNGLFYLTITGSALISGQTGYLVLYDPATGHGCSPIALPVKNYFEA